jgi:hypothetical protein
MTEKGITIECHIRVLVHWFLFSGVSYCDNRVRVLIFVYDTKEKEHQNTRQSGLYLEDSAPRTNQISLCFNALSLTWYTKTHRRYNRQVCCFHICNNDHLSTLSNSRFGLILNMSPVLNWLGFMALDWCILSLTRWENIKRWTHLHLLVFEYSTCTGPCNVYNMQLYKVC